MSEIDPPPIYDPITPPQGDGKLSLRWVQFMNSLFNGDTGTAWIPTFTSLTVSGAPTITGVYYRIGRTLVYFAVTITPATSTTSTAGTTYINNFPLTLTGNGACLAVSGLLGSSAGMCDKATNRIYVPAWSAVTVPLTIVGLVEAN